MAAEEVQAVAAIAYDVADEELVANGSDALRQVGSEKGAWNWCLIGADAKKLPLVGGGAGFVDEMRACLEKHAHAVLFGLIRCAFTKVKGEHLMYKWVLVSAALDVGTMNAVQRGRAVSKRPVMEHAIKSFAHYVLTLDLTDAQDLTVDFVVSRLSAISKGASDGELQILACESSPLVMPKVIVDCHPRRPEVRGHSCSQSIGSAMHHHGIEVDMRCHIEGPNAAFQAIDSGCVTNLDKNNARPKEQIPYKGCQRRVTFATGLNTIHEITPYSEVYGVHPRTFNFDRHIPSQAWHFVAPTNTLFDTDTDLDGDADDEEEEEEEEEEQPCIFQMCAAKSCQADVDMQIDISDEVATQSPGSSEGSPDCSSDECPSHEGEESATPSPSQSATTIEDGPLTTSRTVDDMAAWRSRFRDSMSARAASRRARFSRNAQAAMPDVGCASQSGYLSFSLSPVRAILYGGL